MAATIIIFGAAVAADGRPSATLLRRTRAAFDFGGVMAFYLPTGGVGRYGPSEASLMRDLLLGWGVPPARITLEETATDTLSSALACAALLGGRGEVYAASSAYHLPRCLMLLRLAGIAARRCPPPRFRLEPYWVMREAVALPWDAWLMLRRRYLK
jgi:uncharacterized SAM-binding protein YcdF (DUF218 family)